jgi:hypothetical protein
MKVLSYIKNGILAILGIVLMVIDRVMWSWNPFVHLPSVNYMKHVPEATRADSDETLEYIETLKNEAKETFTLKYLKPAKKRLAWTTVITGTYFLITWIF